MSVFHNIDELKTERRKDSKSFFLFFDEILNSKKLLADFKNCPFHILDEAGFQVTEDDYLDMTTQNWCSLSPQNQQKYTFEYQEWYAKQQKKEVEKVFKLAQDLLKMRLIPPGKYLHHNKQHQFVKSFWCGKYLITQKQWKELMEKNPSEFQGEDKPVEMISWEDCKIFCEKTDFDLLTQEQWEFACQGGSTYKYFFGDNEEDLENFAWYLKNSERVTHTVGEKKPNYFGLHDTYGNVAEWCFEGKDIDNKNSSVQVTCGGAWNSNATDCLSYLFFPSNYRNYDVGFRVCSPE